MDAREERRSGTQSLERAVCLLRELSLSGHSGAKLSELAARSGLRASTAHRILACLTQARLVRQSADDRHYMLGPLLFELGISASPERADFQHVMRNRLWALARDISAVGFLFYRSDDDFVCAVRAGTAKCKAKDTPVFPGTRRQLSLGAGGIAILLALGQEEALAVVERNRARVDNSFAPAIERVRHLIRHSESRSFVANAGDILPGVNAFSLALRNQAGEPFAAISIAGPARDFPLERVDHYRDLLHAMAQDLPGAQPYPTLSEGFRQMVGAACA
jgi:DNA-binding IclR family transcriptional regulator